MESKNFLFTLSKIDREIIAAREIGLAFMMLGKDLFCAMMKGKEKEEGNWGTL